MKPRSVRHSYSILLRNQIVNNTDHFCPIPVVHFQTRIVNRLDHRLDDTLLGKVTQLAVWFVKVVEHFGVLVGGGDHHATIIQILSANARGSREYFSLQCRKIHKVLWRKSLRKTRAAGLVAKSYAVRL